VELYSEHTSFSELEDCIKWLNPRQVIPCVNNNGSQASGVDDQRLYSR